MDEWIVSNPGILGGKPCVRGTRISFEQILDLLAAGRTQADILAAYPHLPGEGLLAAITYAARVVHDERVWEVKVPA